MASVEVFRKTIMIETNKELENLMELGAFVNLVCLDGVWFVDLDGTFTMDDLRLIINKIKTLENVY